MKITTKHPCTRCDNPAAIFQPYSGMYLCKQHLIDDVTRKAKRDLRKYNLPPGTIAVALSGGKDSSVLLHLLHTILAPNRKIKIVAITVDEASAATVKKRSKTQATSPINSELHIPSSRLRNHSEERLITS